MITPPRNTPAGAEQVCEASAEQQQSTEGDDIGVEDPGQVLLGEAEVFLPTWQGHSVRHTLQGYGI